MGTREAVGVSDDIQTLYAELGRAMIADKSVERDDFAGRWPLEDE